jgi:hypothetical protein
MMENSLVVTRFGQSPQKRADGWLAETTVAWRKPKIGIYSFRMAQPSGECRLKTV